MLYLTIVCKDPRFLRIPCEDPCFLRIFCEDPRFLRILFEDPRFPVIFGEDPNFGILSMILGRILGFFGPVLRIPASVLTSLQSFARIPDS